MIARADGLVVQMLLRQYHAATVVPLLERIAELERQCEQMRHQLERGHRGKFVPGALYERGDEVSRNGSTWRALVDDPKDGPPGDEWALVAQGRAELQREVQRGRNGRN